MSHVHRLEGIIPILSMPFLEDDAVDLDSLVAEAAAESFEQSGEFRCEMAWVVEEQPLARADGAEFFRTDEDVGDFGGEWRAFQTQIEQFQYPSGVGGGMEESNRECVWGLL